MKALVLILIGLFCSSGFAETATLQELFDSQNTLTIEPVLYDGLPVGSNEAAKLCSILGYTRVVSVQDTLCGSGNWVWRSRKAETPGATELEMQACSSRSRILTALVCAGN